MARIDRPGGAANGGEAPPVPFGPWSFGRKQLFSMLWGFLFWVESGRYLKGHKRILFYFVSMFRIVDLDLVWGKSLMFFLLEEYIG